MTSSAPSNTVRPATKNHTGSLYSPNESGDKVFYSKNAANENLKARLYEIVLIEDSTANALLVKRALDSLGLTYRLTFLNKGADALP